MTSSYQQLQMGTVWPEDRKAGLTFGELSAIKLLLSHYLLGHNIQDKRNGLNFMGESSRDAITLIYNSWNNATVSESTREQLVPAMNKLLAAFGAFRPDKRLMPDLRYDLKSWNGYGGGITTGITWPWQAFVPAIGIEVWWRLVGVLATDRDFFTENLEEVGGVKAGLNDTVQDLLETAPAVRGRWVPLAGRWFWKGIAADGRPIINSQPLVRQPGPMPYEWPQADAETRAVFALLGDLAEQAGAANLGAAVPGLVAQVNGLAQVLTDVEPIDVPHTPRGAMEAIYHLLKAVKVSGESVLKSAWAILLPQAIVVYDVMPDPMDDYDFEEETELDLSDEAQIGKVTASKGI